MLLVCDPQLPGLSFRANTIIRSLKGKNMFCILLFALAVNHQPPSQSSAFPVYKPFLCLLSSLLSLAHLAWSLALRFILSSSLTPSAYSTHFHSLSHGPCSLPHALYNIPFFPLTIMFTVRDFYNFPLCACSSLLSIFHCAGAFDTLYVLQNYMILLVIEKSIYKGREWDAQCPWMCLDGHIWILLGPSVL